MTTHSRPVIPEKLIFLDLETTGANFANDRVIEIGVIVVEDGDVQVWQTLVNPGVGLSSFITGLTGITDQMLEHAPSFDQVATQLSTVLQGGLFIAHNARFDYGFLKGEYQRLGNPFKMPCLCTVKLSRKLFPEYHQHSLDALIQRHGISVENRHRALDDAKILWELWQIWHGMLDEKNIHATVQAIIGLPHLPPQLDAAIIDELPEAPGAYVFLDEAQRPLQIRSSANIRQQIISTLAKKQVKLTEHLSDIRYQESAGQLGAKLHEYLFSRQYQQKGNTWENLCAWQLVKDADGDFSTRLVAAPDTDLATADEVYGFYKDKRQAMQTLRKLAQIHHLCPAQLGLENLKPGEACSHYAQKTCRGVCVGKENLSVHSARLMSALSKHRIHRWPYATPIAIVERDHFGMREDYHLIDRWHYLGMACHEAQLNDLFEHRDKRAAFDPELYKIIHQTLASGKYRVIPLQMGC